MKDIPIIIVDDHILFSQALKGLVNKFEGYQVIAQLKNGQELIDYFVEKKESPAIILMDVNMPIINGVDATKWITEFHPKVKVLALTMIDDESVIINMICAGASGFLLKDIHPNTLLEALNKVMTDGVYYTDRVTKALINATTHKSIELKERELIFLKYACSDMSYQQIADKMCLSYKTIDGYRESIFDKFNVSSRIGMVLYALKEKMVEIK
ncbi:MAG: DNA-binding response regulator [Flavobacteriales bacterium CG03_land_8_20_14_0_80_35_15]|nr:response regulator transcription factor [Zetaproteobacteria bacterium]PIV16601.1 MAG: DNA-binding response regulator [Flavobacteriales bacterium CG03_land_8_20_14_0_80_35_15]PIX07332.1 MAG: DNA-binding response regulator [Flavobacteriales bacterium CG_4_8_14_3_um_filter_35_10]PJA04982.1 MAG: DNA-binding response regulator [Flavobacteriales bacterium CG_4_10_14_0_2_um_filter_35_18]